MAAARGCATFAEIVVDRLEMLGNVLDIEVVIEVVIWGILETSSFGVIVLPISVACLSVAVVDPTRSFVVCWVSDARWEKLGILEANEVG